MTGQFFTLRSLTLALTLTLSISQACAQATGHPPEHPPLQKSSSINFATAVEQALQLAPEEILQVSASEQADSAVFVADRWIVGSPVWQASLIDDRLQSDRGLRELESGIAVNLWRPGERQDARARGSAYEARSAALQRYLRWVIAGRVRSNLAELERADLQLSAARQSELDALQLLETTRRLQNAGAASALDVLQAENLWLQQSRMVLEASAALVDAERAWQVLTGLTVRPSDTHQETRSAQEEIEADHPLLAWHQSEISIRESDISDAERIARGSPSISLGLRRERGDWQQNYIDSVGVSVTIPITSRAVVAAGTTDARAARADTELVRLQALRELTAQLHEVEHELFTLEQALPLTQRQRDVSQQQWQMAQTAFNVGEADLTYVILALQRAHDSSREYELQLLRRQHLNTEYNQITGVLP